MADFGLYGLAVMGQNFALNVAEKGFRISVCNRSPGKVDDCVRRASEELGMNVGNLRGFYDPERFIASLSKPRKVMFLVQAGAPVDTVIDLLMNYLEPGDLMIDGGNEWYENSIRRSKYIFAKGIMYIAMGGKRG